MIGFIKVLSPQQDLARFQRVSLDVAALLFCFGATMLTALLFGLIPALKLSKTNIGTALKDEGSGSSLIGPRQQRMQSILIMAQLALACVLLIGAGLLARSFQATQSLPLGFNPDHLLAVQIELPSIRYESDKHSFTFFENLLEKVRRLPGVSAAAVNPDPPFNDWSDVEPFGLTGKPDAEPGQEPTLEWQDVMPSYFQTLGIPLLSGRDFDENDLQRSQSVVIIDQAMATRLFPGQDPLGKQIHDYDERYGQGRHDFTIVGIARNARHDSTDAHPADFQAYFPFPPWLRDGILLVRTEGDPLALVPAVRTTVASIDPTVALSKISTFHDWIGKKFVTRRLGMLLVSLFSGIALFLSAIGLYGVLAYSVSQRRREIGVRMAIGAQAMNILGLIMRQGVRIVSIGLLSRNCHGTRAGAFYQ